MKAWVKKKIRQSEKASDLIVSFLSGFKSIYDFSLSSSTEKKILKGMFKTAEYEVVNGAFKGLKYPSAESAGSSLGLKILGIYEEELSSIIKKVIYKPYKELWDIGAAEGYYAVGLARLIPELNVYAYDIDPYARTLLKRMSIYNHVEKRVHIRSLCTPDTIAKHPIGKDTLFIIDCEGYEKELLSTATAKYLTKCDILVEVHDNVDVGQTETLDQIHEAFCKTHDICVINSLGTVEKAYLHMSEKWRKGISDEEYFRFMSERLWRMKWLFMTSKIVM